MSETNLLLHDQLARMQIFILDYAYPYEFELRIFR
jgi:hypothetical protein